jgi:hypothetical protein
MPSPFPGMDPFIEGPPWESFHAAFACDIADSLSRSMPSEYVAELGRRSFSDRETIRGVEMFCDFREAYIDVIAYSRRELVTVVEIMSPMTKRMDTNGRTGYRRRREALLASHVNFVEVDLLRGGERSYVEARHRSCDYLANVHRAHRRPHADAHAWSLRDRMPVIPIPLRSSNAEACIDLQELFERRYDLTRYDDSINYERPLNPPLGEDDAEWIAERLRTWRAA